VKEARNVARALMAIPVAEASVAWKMETMAKLEPRGYAGAANCPSAVRHAHCAEGFVSPLAYSSTYQDRYSSSISLHSQQNMRAHFVSLL
jgi:hypothetical protein